MYNMLGGTNSNAISIDYIVTESEGAKVLRYVVLFRHENLMFLWRHVDLNIMMEDIITKNIFHDNDLNKLSPDYSPPDVTLRMHERRTMFRDSHSHILMDNNWNRKTNKKVKDGFKINKEIVKLRNGYHKSNLKNQIIMRDCVRKATYKSGLENYEGDLLLNDLKILHDDTEKCMQDIKEDMSKLVLHNTSDFKVNNKSKPEKISNENRRNKNKPLSSIKKTNKDDDNIYDEHFIKIKCTYGNKSPENKISNSSELESHDETVITTVKVDDDPINNVEHSFDAQDLQTLLIMMAISKSSNKDEAEISGNHKNMLKTSNFAPEAHVEIDALQPSTEERNVADILNIIPLRLEMNERETKIANKYLGKWKGYVSKRKEIMNKQRQACLSTFFDKLSKKKIDANAKKSNISVNKAKMLARDYNTYQQRYQVQKHIIALQKTKLEEQSRLIEELKYNRIIEASRQSVDAMKDEIRKTYYDIDRQLKPKIKCLTNELKLHEIEEPALVLHCLKVPRFLQRMEKRAREREEKHAMIRERRKQMEEERIRLKQQAELAKAEMDKEEKIKRMQELRDKRKKEKIENIRKKQHAARLRSLIVMADLHYERTLKAKYGIRPFRILLKIKRDNIEKAKLHYAFQLKKNVFLNWMWYTEDMWFERNYMADEFNRKKTLKKAFNSFKLNVHGYSLKKQVADDYYDLFVTQLVFRKFREAINIVKKENELKYQKAVKYYNSNVLFKIITCWRTLPALNALQREQEARKARWREKVLMVVPDYIPPED